MKFSLKKKKKVDWARVEFLLVSTTTETDVRFCYVNIGEPPFSFQWAIYPPMESCLPIQRAIVVLLYSLSLFLFSLFLSLSTLALSA